MAKYNFKAPTKSQPESHEEKYNGKHPCIIFGCPRIATIEINNHWNCRYHNLRAGSMLDGITLILKNHEREINWYEKVINMAYHEYDVLKGNAPASMMHLPNEDLIKYRVRMAQYISLMFKHPDRMKIPVTKTYADITGGFDD